MDKQAEENAKLVHPGDCLEITGNSNEHPFGTGQLVTVVDWDEFDPEDADVGVECTKLYGGEHWFVRHTDYRRVEWVHESALDELQAVALRFTKPNSIVGEQGQLIQLEQWLQDDMNKLGVWSLDALKLLGDISRMSSDDGAVIVQRVQAFLQRKTSQQPKD